MKLWCLCVCLGKSDSVRLVMDAGHVLSEGVVWRGLVGGGGGFLEVGWGLGGGGVVWGLFCLSHRFFIMSTLGWYYM